MNYEKIKIEANYTSVYLFLKQNGFSENYISNLRKKWGFIKLNGEIVNVRKPLSKDDILEVHNNPNTKTSIMHCILPLDIVYEDDYYLAINKPSGLATMPTKSHYNSNLAGAVCEYMKDKDKKFVLRVVNRLDKDTAGLVLVAKNSVAMNKLTDIKKTYYAICDGLIQKSLVIDKNIETLSTNGIIILQRIVSENGKPAKTYVTPVKQLGINTLLKITLEHGRTHQIRVHMSSIGHPLLGDTIYGSKSGLINHTALLCKELSFYHPYTEKEIALQIPFPSDFNSLII